MLGACVVADAPDRLPDRLTKDSLQAPVLAVEQCSSGGQRIAAKGVLEDACSRTVAPIFQWVDRTAWEVGCYGMGILSNGLRAYLDIWDRYSVGDGCPVDDQ